MFLFSSSVSSPTFRSNTLDPRVRLTAISLSNEPAIDVIFSISRKIAPDRKLATSHHIIGEKIRGRLVQHWESRSPFLTLRLVQLELVLGIGLVC